jgi:DNA-binding FrmR family transcriptional regulator
MTQIEDEAVKEELLTRLRNVKGHITGIEGMIEKDKDCSELLIQLSAIKSSINKIGLTMAENSACQCILESIQEGKEVEEAVQEALGTILKFNTDFE